MTLSVSFSLTGSAIAVAGPPYLHTFGTIRHRVVGRSNGSISPDSQIRAAADQYEAARQRLDMAPPGAGVVLPLINTAAVAVELYLKPYWEKTAWRDLCRITEK